ncbi:MAG: EAL domain-containing protein [Pseudomonadota bacterium]
MRIRNVMICAMLAVALVPSFFVGVWSYRDSFDREIRDATQHHSIIAGTVKTSLGRFRNDVVAAVDSFANAMIVKRLPPQMEQFMRRLGIDGIILLDAKSREILNIQQRPMVNMAREFTAEKRSELVSIAELVDTKFTGLVTNWAGRKVIYAVRRFENYVAVAQIDTGYLRDLIATVEFGNDGHAVIVDRFGAVIATTEKSPILAGKSVLKPSLLDTLMDQKESVRFTYDDPGREMFGVKELLPSVGWSVLVAQPISEIFEMSYQALKTMILALSISLLLGLFAVLIIARHLTGPLERMVEAMLDNASNKKLRVLDSVSGNNPVTELHQLENSYNLMAQRVSRANSHIRKLAFLDGLTGLPNRARFQESFDELLADPVACAQGGAVFFVDMDNFKEINDLHGHDLGDDFLRACAATLVSATEEWYETIQKGMRLSQAKLLKPVMVSRVGGDEFTILLPGLVDENEIQSFLSFLLERIITPSSEVGYLARASASIGCVSYPRHGKSAEALMKRADLAMYRAKKHGKNRGEIYNVEMGAQTDSELRRDVLQAIESGEMFLEYQPQVDAKTRDVVGVEALVRWNHHERGVVAPSEWLAAIENSSVITTLGEWVLDRAISDSRKWEMKGHAFRVSINIGSRHIISPGFLSNLEEIVRRNEFDRSRMELEVTEDAVFSHESVATKVITRLRKLGYRVAIDDFGKGYSNIVKLSELNVDTLKLDRSLVAGAQKDTRMRSILSTSLDLAKALDCQTVVEGVETIRQVDFVTHMGADVLQGYYFAKSMTAEEMIEWVEQEVGQPNFVHQQQAALTAEVA